LSPKGLEIKILTTKDFRASFAVLAHTASACRCNCCSNGEVRSDVPRL
jgi:hypothetical protein